MWTVATTTWNSIDLVTPFLVHYRRLGFDRVFVMDFNSTDGTRRVLECDEWRGFVELVAFPGIAALDSSNLLLTRAKQVGEANHWCLFCDPDELLVTPSMDVRAGTRTNASVTTESWAIPRFNVTAPLSVARATPHRLSAGDALTLRIDRRQPRLPKVASKDDDLDPPWIYFAILGKVLVFVEEAISINEGDHSVHTLRQTASAAPPGTYLLHYPFRGYDTFRNKISLARRGFDANPHLSQDNGWHVRRWIRLSDSGRLYDEYLRQFVPDHDLNRLLATGTVVFDHSVQALHGGQS